MKPARLVQPMLERASLTLSDIKWAIRTNRAKRLRQVIDPVGICVTGSSGKSTTSGLLAHILREEGETLQRDYRNDEWNIIRLLLDLRPDHKYLVAEAGVAFPGTMKSLAEVLQPDIAIVTMVGLEHYSRFGSRELIAYHKGEAVAAIRPGGFAVLNADDSYVASMASRTCERVVTFGCDSAADYRVTATRMTATGLIVSMTTPRGDLDIETRFMADHFKVPVAAAVAAASDLGIRPETISDRAGSYDGLFSRFQLVRPPGGPSFVLDTIKAPLGTLDAAFNAFSLLDAPAKRIVLGQISDYAGNPRKVYREAYKAARAVCDQVIFVGEHAHRSQASEEDRRSGRFVQCDTPAEVSEFLRDNGGPDDLVLLKGSGNLHLERIALARDGDVLCWEPYCGLRINCRECGLAGFPFSEHRAKRRELNRRGK